MQPRGSCYSSLAAPELPPMRDLAGRLTERFRGWRRHRRWVGEMADAAALGRLDELLDDVAMSRADLRFLIDAPDDAGLQFEQFADMAQLDLRQISPEVLREARWVCARCEHRSPCKRWLREGVWDDAGDPRCPNAALLHSSQS